MENIHEEHYFPSKNFVGEISKLDTNQTKEAIFEKFTKLKKWREEQLAHFRSMQLLDANQIDKGLQKQTNDELPENGQGARDSSTKDFFCVSSPVIAENSDINGSSTLQESSITGHLERCFGDSDLSSPSVQEKKAAFEVINPPLLSGLQGGKFSEKILNAGKDRRTNNAEQSSAERKPKRPFLKKGTGLLRYQPRSSCAAFEPSAPLSSSQQSASHIPPNSLKLKPALRTSSVPPEQMKHIRFYLPSDEAVHTEDLDNQQSSCPSNKTEDDPTRTHPVAESSRNIDDEQEKETKDELNAVGENLKLSKEKKELEEFELLENIALNSSFSSDSSFVQKVLHGENILGQKNESNRPYSAQENLNRPSTAKPVSKSENPIFSAKMGLSKCLEEVQARKEIVNKVLSDINPRIQSLQKEINGCDGDFLNSSDVSDGCSSPEENPYSERRDLVTIPETSDLDDAGLGMEARHNLCGLFCKTCNAVGDSPVAHHKPLKEIDSDVDSSPEDDRKMAGKLKIREKMAELEKEIEIYQEHNKRLDSVCRERDEFLRKMKKEREDFNKYKEAEKKKLEAEMQEERKQIKRQKETFARYQKLRKDHPTRKEREECNSLRQEVEKLQEELKRQKIKYNNDCRRLRSQLESAERDRDTLKLDNIRLEDQVQDLLTALKVRLKNNPETLVKPVEQTSHTMAKMAENSSEAKDVVSDEPKTKKESTQPKTSVPPHAKTAVSKGTVNKNEMSDCRFDESKGSPLLQNAEPGPVSERTANTSPKPVNVDMLEFSLSEEMEDSIASNQQSEPRGVLETNYEGELQKLKNRASSDLSAISVTIEAEFKELNYGERIERIYNSGDREIIFKSGTRKFIGCDGKTQTIFFNGDKKECFPDGRKIYTFLNGRTETVFPDGLEVIEFPSGDIKRSYPDGREERKFLDGFTQNLFANGSEEIKAADGDVVHFDPDGTKIILYANGQKEIQTATYKKREFPDGSMKIKFASGMRETRYPNGRLKIKDKEGKTIIDTKYST